MQIIGVDLHTRQQTVAMLNVETGEIVYPLLAKSLAKLTKSVSYSHFISQSMHGNMIAASWSG
jgi:hypothetical protein